MTTFFKKKKPQRNWTWISPNGKTRNEIDFILSNERAIIKDVTVLNRVTTGSDHKDYKEQRTNMLKLRECKQEYKYKKLKKR